MAVADNDPPLVRERFSIPPLDSNPGALSISVVAQAVQDGLNTWALFYSDHILVNVIRALKRRINWPEPDVIEYVQFIRQLADASGGGTARANQSGLGHGVGGQPDPGSRTRCGRGPPRFGGH